MYEFKVVSYAALLLTDSKVEVTAENLSAVIKASGNKVINIKLWLINQIMDLIIFFNSVNIYWQYVFELRYWKNFLNKIGNFKT